MAAVLIHSAGEEHRNSHINLPDFITSLFGPRIGFKPPEFGSLPVHRGATAASRSYKSEGNQNCI